MQKQASGATLLVAAIAGGIAFAVLVVLLVASGITFSANFLLAGVVILAAVMLVFSGRSGRTAAPVSLDEDSPSQSLPATEASDTPDDVTEQDEKKTEDEGEAVVNNHPAQGETTIDPAGDEDGASMRPATDAIVEAETPDAGEPVESDADSQDIGHPPAKLDAPRNGEPDDLKQIRGIGPKLETQLHDIGIYHLDQIAGWSAEEQAWIDENLEGFKRRASRDEWVRQARELTQG